jgi:hypothetical protein
MAPTFFRSLKVQVSPATAILQQPAMALLLLLSAETWHYVDSYNVLMFKSKALSPSSD